VAFFASVTLGTTFRQRPFVKPTPRPRVAGRDVAANGESNHAKSSQVVIVECLRIFVLSLFALITLGFRGIS
jgi:hypothetical protein